MSRQRRANVDGGRVHRHEVKVSPEEEATIAVAAQEQGIGWVRFLVEAGMAVARAGDEVAVETPTARRARMAELFALQTRIGELALQVKRVGGNVNQVARAVHRGADVPLVEMREFLVAEQQHLVQARELYDRISVLIDEMSERGVLV